MLCGSVCSNEASIQRPFKMMLLKYNKDENFVGQCVLYRGQLVSRDNLKRCYLFKYNKDENVVRQCVQQ